MWPGNHTLVRISKVPWTGYAGVWPGTRGVGLVKWPDQGAWSTLTRACQGNKCGLAIVSWSGYQRYPGQSTPGYYTRNDQWTSLKFDVPWSGYGHAKSLRRHGAASIILSQSVKGGLGFENCPFLALSTYERVSRCVRVLSKGWERLLLN